MFNATNGLVREETVYEFSIENNMPKCIGNTV